MKSAIPSTPPPHLLCLRVRVSWRCSSLDSSPPSRRDSPNRRESRYPPISRQRRPTPIVCRPRVVLSLRYCRVCNPNAIRCPVGAAASWRWLVLRCTASAVWDTGGVRLGRRGGEIEPMGHASLRWGAHVLIVGHKGGKGVNREGGIVGCGRVHYA